MSKTVAVITGLGIVSSQGHGTANFVETLRKGQSRFVTSNQYPSLNFPVIAAELQPFNFETSLRQVTSTGKLFDAALKAGRRAPLCIQVSIIAAIEAWQQANLSERYPNGERIGLVIAGQNITQRYQYETQHLSSDSIDYLSPTYAMHFMDTDHLGILSEIFGILGEGFTVGGASASGNVGIIQAARLIEQKMVDACLVVGPMAHLSPFEIQGFYNIGALGGKANQKNPGAACRPFDKQHDGFILGQGCGSLVLESFQEEKGTAIYGHISGYAMKLDATRLAHPTIEGEARVMQDALKHAQLTINDVQYLNTHGSSSPLGDEVEVQAIKQVFGDKSSSLWLNSTKSITGHCLWSAGIIECIAIALQIENNFLHPNLNLDYPIDLKCKFVGKSSIDATIKTAMSNSFGFGGINTSIVFSKGAS